MTEIIKIYRENGKVKIADSLFGEENKVINTFDCLEDAIDELRERIDEEGIRFCSECDKAMNTGYCINGGEKYYCSDKCLHKHYTPEEWLDMYEDGGDSYWTEWY